MTAITRADIDDQLSRLIDTFEIEPGVWAWAIMREWGVGGSDYVQGRHTSHEAAMRAGINYFRKMRPDLVRAAIKEENEAQRYRATQA